MEMTRVASPESVPIHLKAKSFIERTWLKVYTLIRRRRTQHLIRAYMSVFFNCNISV